MRFTEKTIRNDYQWVKITRDNSRRVFTFAKGRKGDYQAYSIEALTFKWVANWTEALERAERSLQF